MKVDELERLAAKATLEAGAAGSEAAFKACVKFVRNAVLDEVAGIADMYSNTIQASHAYAVGQMHAGQEFAAICRKMKDSQP